MRSRLRSFFGYFLDVEPEERLKVLLLTVGFFFVIGAYTITKELKDSLFVSIVGTDYQPKAKMIVMFVLIPAIFFYSRLVDILRKHHLLYFYTILYTILGFIFAYFLGHPQIGLANTESSPYRIFGWLFYFFIESYSPFVVSVFWSFANSITSPEAAQSNYTLMVSGSKFGGMLGAIFAWKVLDLKTSSGAQYFSDVTSHQLLLAGASLLLAVVPFAISLLIKLVPKKNLHGYEAAYRLEKKEHKEELQHKNHHKETAVHSMFSGLILLLKNPYVLGIFGIGFFYELINSVFSFERLVIGKRMSASASELSLFLFKQIFWSHLIGFFIVLFGVRPIINFLGERRSLMLVPVTIGLLLFYFTLHPDETVLWVFVIVRSLNYGFTQPLREALYTVTIKEIQFKSKSWIDAFGNKFAKTCGSTFNDFTKGLSYAMHSLSNSILFCATISLWLGTSYLLGRRFDKAVEDNEVIGQKDIK